ncbi:hypothetical protein ACWDN5_46435, partial [Amycolatopsis sp. NPDC003731]
MIDEGKAILIARAVVDRTTSFGEFAAALTRRTGVAGFDFTTSAGRASMASTGSPRAKAWRCPAPAAGAGCSGPSTSASCTNTSPEADGGPRPADQMPDGFRASMSSG